MKALILEDEDSLREILRIILEDFNYEVEEARSLKEGLEKLKKDNYHLIIADLRLPDGSGMEVVRKAKSVKESPEVIIITAYATTETVKEAFELGVYDYIEKPFKLEELKLILRNV